MAQAGAADEEAHPACLQLPQRLQKPAVLHRQPDSGVDQDDPPQTLHLGQGADEVLHELVSQLLVSAANAVRGDEHELARPPLRLADDPGLFGSGLQVAAGRFFPLRGGP